MKGFYIPGSQSSSYVASKRNEEGSFAYDAAAIGAGIQKQAALQDLSKQYESTIENAYAAYLATQRGIDTSAMGQGYKEAYKEKQQQNLISNIAEANQNAATVRAQIENQASQSREALDKQFKTETANLDRVAATMNDYLTYVKGLSGSYLEDKPVDELYEALYNYQPQGFTDEEGQAGLPYSEWIKNQLKDTADDKAWSQWLFYQGGLQDFMNAARQGKQQYSFESPNKIKEVQEQEKAKEDLQKELNEREQDKNYAGYFSDSAAGFTKVGGVTMGSPTSIKISEALDIENKLYNGQLKVGNVIKFNNEYYEIVDVRPIGSGKYGQVSYNKLRRAGKKNSKPGSHF